MKKRGMKNLSLNKKSVSNLNAEVVTGGRLVSMACSAGETCTGQQSCGNCTVGGSGTLAECEPNTMWGMCPQN